MTHRAWLWRQASILYWYSALWLIPQRQPMTAEYPENRDKFTTAPPHKIVDFILICGFTSTCPPSGAEANPIARDDECQLMDCWCHLVYGQPTLPCPGPTCSGQVTLPACRGRSAATGCPSGGHCWDVRAKVPDPPLHSLTALQLQGESQSWLSSTEHTHTHTHTQKHAYIQKHWQT